jgi:hypothetical protein
MLFKARKRLTWKWRANRSEQGPMLEELFDTKEDAMRALTG